MRRKVRLEWGSGEETGRNSSYLSYSNSGAVFIGAHLRFTGMDSFWPVMSTVGTLVSQRSCIPPHCQTYRQRSK